MSKYILGLDINDTLLAAVVLQQKGKERHIVSCDSIELEGQVSLADSLSLLLEKVSWQGGSCVCGISLVDVSIRTLTIPFTDKKKITQVLSFELEDQLLVPVSEQVVEYVFTGQSDTTSNLLITAIEKETLRHLFAALAHCDALPDVVGIRLAAFAEQTLKIRKAAADIIFIEAGQHSVNILLCHAGEVVFLRHFPYPEKMVIAPPFSFAGNKVSIIHDEEAMDCISCICADINRTLGIFNLESGLQVSPEKIVASGSLGQLREFQEKVQAEFNMPVVVSNIREETAIPLSPAAQEKWAAGDHDVALCLALEGLQKRHLINFRKDEFSSSQLFSVFKGRFLAAAVIMVLALGAGLVYLGFDYNALKTRYDDMGSQMLALFKETFPDRTKIRDPLVEMQASIKSIQAPSVAMPVFTGDKRTLNVLADLSARIPPSIELRISRLVVDQESVQIKGTTDTFNNVNIIQNNMRQSPLYQDVDIISAAADKNSNMIRFELKMEAGGA